MKSLKSFSNFEDPSLSSHLQTIHNEKNNLPKLKYSLACIANTLAYTNSNRHYDILSIAKHFKLIVFLIANHQDQKILEECLSILNVLLNQGNDITIQQLNQIMHSLSYVKVTNQVEKGFITDKLVQEILSLTYKVKTKTQLSEFLSTLISEKMTASQAKKFIKDLKKQQLKNISVANLIKIGLKFKTNILLMNQILNLIYQKVFLKRDINDIKKLMQFLPKIVEENIEQESISYKCLQIYKIIENQNFQLDPLISKYLKSLLLHKKDIFLPLKRQFVANQQDFINILQYGKQYQIYHLLIVDYLLKNGFENGKQKWCQSLQQNQSKKNLKLKQICFRVGNHQQYNSKAIKCQISESDQLSFIQLLPIQTLRNSSSLLQKLLIEPSISNCLHVIKKLCFHKQSSQLLLTIHRNALKQKQFHLVEQIQKIVKQSFTEQFIYNQLKNITKVKHKIVLKGQLYFIWLPILVKQQKLIKNLQNQLIQIMNYDSIDIEDKFYVVQFLLQNKMGNVVIKFLLYLNRQLQAINSLQEQSKKQAEDLFAEIKFYLKKWVKKIKDNTQIIDFFFHKLLFHLERTSELLFSKMVQFKSDSITTLLFQLQKWGYYGEIWRQSYRWILTSLQQISDQNPNYTLDCLELFQMCIQNIKQHQIPSFAKDRFMKLIIKNWSKFQSQQIFAIQRTVQILWQNHQYPILQQLSPIIPISELIERQKTFNQKHQYFFQSQHPTSNYVLNLQLSHFFGLMSQEQFIRYILQLYDKKFSQVKRFTQNNIISLMNFIIWIFQYSQDDMDKGLCDMTLAFLSYKAEGSYQISSYNIRKKCVQIVATVSHSINLLKLPIKQLLQTYIGQANVMKNINEILQIIIQSKPSFLEQLNLEKIVQSVMISLITCQDLDLIEEYINFIEAICYIQESKYAIMFQNSMQVLYQILKIEFKVVQKYRKDLILFTLDILKHYDFTIQNSLLWYLMNKYFVEQDIQINIIESLIKNKGNKTWNKLEYSNQKLLVRLIMHHNENQQLIKMVQQILNNSEKQVPIIKPDPQTQPIKKSVLTTIVQAPQKAFIDSFKKQQFAKSQQLVSEIRNPLLIVLKKEDLKPFLIIKQLNSFQNLINFLIKNPTTRNEILSVEEFYTRTECTPYIFKLNETLTWTPQNLQRLKFTDFNEDTQLFQIQVSNLQTILKSTVSNLFCTPNVKKNIIFLLKTLKSQKQQIELLSFYSKLISQSSNNLLFQIINDIQLEQGVQLMKLNMSYKISNPSAASCQMLLFHLYVHLENSFSLKSPELENQQRYIKDVVQNICPHEMQKHLPTATEMFINISSKLDKKINSKFISELLNQIAYRYLFIFEGGNQNVSAKVLQIKQIDCFGAISALLLMYKHGENIQSGLPAKIISLLQNKVGQNEVLKKAFDYLVQCQSKIVEISKNKENQKVCKPPNDPQFPKKSNGKWSLTDNKIKKPSESNSVVFAKELVKQDEPDKKNEQENQLNEAFKKGKQLEEYMSVAPRQIKALAQKQEKQKSIPKVIDTPSELFDQQNLIRPKQSVFDEVKYHQVEPQTPSKILSQSQRKQNLQNIKAKQNQEISIATLKEHGKFVTTLFDCNCLTKQELEELMKSIDNIISTVNEHHYYVKKLIQLEVTFKLINLFKRKERFIPSDLNYFGDIFESKLLKLHHAMSYKKEKKTIVFDDQLTIQFFKFIVQKSINAKKPRQENLVIVQIVLYCLKSIDAFFKQGLISMFMELIKLDIHVEQVLKFFCKIQLNKHIIFQIYQRGLLNKIVEVFSPSNKQSSHSILNLWIKLAGKICTTPAIQQKYVQCKIHKLIWQKHCELLSGDLQSKKNISFLLAALCKKNLKLFQYVVENQILQKLLLALQNQNSEELYMFFYYVASDNESALEYCFRIKYHLHLIQKLSKQGEKQKSKFFFKSLGQIMSNKYHQSLFFKEKVVQKLVRSYQTKSQPSIYECLLDFIVTLDNDKQFEELKRQQFWSCLALFEYKLSSEATYAYILQIFLVMIKKGRIKQFNTAQVRGKVTLKAEYSINLEGKQLALRFITALSLRTKQCYITQRCIRLLASIVGFKVTSNQLDIIQDILDVQGMLQNFEFFSFCQQYEITQIICNNFKRFAKSQLLSALKILNILGTQSKNNKILRDKLLIPAMQMLLQNNQSQNLLSNMIQQWLFKLILVIVSFRQNNEVVQKMQLGKFLINMLQNILKKNPKQRQSILEEYVTVIQMCRQNSMMPLMQLQKVLEKLDKAKVDKEVTRVIEIKQNLQGQVTNQTNQIISKMMEGIEVKMYKSDGSNSDLHLFLTDDRLELNCTAQKGGPVKQKWRLVLSQITGINTFDNEKQFQKSAFYKSSGLFSNAPDRRLCLTVRSKNNQFNIFFTKSQDKNEWKKHIEFAIQNSKKLFNQFK